jgi:glutamate/tyrosine decarboxylase-like PLP-dependent enzyme
VPLSDSPFHQPLQAAFQLALDHFARLDQRPVAPTASLEDLRSRFGKTLSAEGLPAAQVVAELAREVEGGLLGSGGGRFFAWVIGGALPAAVAADWLTAAWDQCAVLYSTSPAAAVIEEVVGAWLKDVLGLPADAGFTLATGAQMAHVTCLAAARHALLDRLGWDVEQQGLYGAPPIRIFSSSERHGSLERAARLLGLGRGLMIPLATDSTGRLEPAALENALGADSGPAIVWLQAGDINNGAYDLFEAVIPIAHRYGAWVHVDGAIGLWAAASPRLRYLIAGMGQADSWVTDGHKWLNVPFDCGYAFVAHPEAHRASMSLRAPYLTQQTAAREPMDWTPEWSRRARAFPTYAALRQLGRNGIADLVDRCCDHAHSLAARIGSLPGAEVLWVPVINQGLVRFLDPRPGASEADHDRRTDAVVAAIIAAGDAYFSTTTWHGRRAMRISVCNWMTSGEDVDRAVNAVARALGSARAAAL